MNALTEEQKELLAAVSARMVAEPIETPRVLLRPFREDDFADFFEFAAQRELQRLSGNPPVSTEAEAREAFAGHFTPEHPPLSFAIAHKADGKVIGAFSVAVHPLLCHDEALQNRRGITLSFVLHEAYQRRGIVTELLRAALAWYFEKTDLEYVNTGYFTFNEGSRRVQEKVGMRYYRDHVYDPEGRKIPTREMILFREEYLALRAR